MYLFLQLKRTNKRTTLAQIEVKIPLYCEARNNKVDCNG
jgi:hypothetical protein